MKAHRLGTSRDPQSKAGWPVPTLLSSISINWSATNWTLENEIASDRVDWILNLGSIPPIPGNACGLGAMLGYLLQNARGALPYGARYDRDLHLHRPSKLAGPRDPRYRMRNDAGMR